MVREKEGARRKREGTQSSHQHLLNKNLEALDQKVGERFLE